MLNYIPIDNDLKTYPQIGSKASEQQMTFLRKDPMHDVEFEHEIKANERREMRRDIFGTVVFVAVIAGLLLW